MTKYILTQAATTSEWDSVSFALIKFTKEDAEKYKLLRQKIKELDVNSITLFGADVDFFIDETELPESAMIDQNGNIDDQIIEIETTEEMTRPENQIRYEETVINNHNIVFSGRGKHTGEEFWCSISYETLEKYTEELNAVEA